MEPEENSLGKGVAVALSSSFFGFYVHASFMAALHDCGIYPDQVAGTSSGAVTAVLCGAGYRSKQLVDFFLQPGLRRSFFDWRAPFRFPGVLTSFYSSGILSGNNAVKYLRDKLHAAQLEDFKHPRVQIAVTNLTKRESHMIEKGDAAEWAIASCSIPGLFCNRLIDGDRWCDGGVAIHIPLDHWLDDPEIHTIVMHSIDHTPGTELIPKRPTIATGIAESHDTICKVTTEMRMKLAELKGKRVLNIRTQSDHPGLFPRQQRHAMAEFGRATGLRTAEQLKALLTAVHDERV